MKFFNDNSLLTITDNQITIQQNDEVLTAAAPIWAAEIIKADKPHIKDVDFSNEGNERMSCQYNGEDLVIAFNARFLIEMLSATESNEVNIELSTPTKAGLIKPVDKEDSEELLMLVMPLMLNQ